MYEYIYIYLSFSFYIFFFLFLSLSLSTAFTYTDGANADEYMTYNLFPSESYKDHSGIPEE